MSKCCEKKVFKCEDMDGVGKIFVRTNATLKAEAPIRFKTDSGYVQETTFEKGVDISMDETAIKVDLSKYPTKEEVDKEINRNKEVIDSDISVAKDNIKEWVENKYPTKEDVDNDISLAKDWVSDNYTKKEDFNRELSGLNDYIQSGLNSVREETEKTYLKKSDATSGNIEYINETNFDVSTNDTNFKTANGLIISFKKYAEKALFSFEENGQRPAFNGIYAQAWTTFEITTGLLTGEINNTYLNGIVKTGENIYRITLIFANGTRTKFTISGTVEKIK